MLLVLLVLVLPGLLLLTSIYAFADAASHGLVDRRRLSPLRGSKRGAESRESRGLAGVHP